MRVEVTCGKCVANVLVLDVPPVDPRSEPLEPRRPDLSAAVYAAGWDGRAIVQLKAPLVGVCTECRNKP